MGGSPYHRSVPRSRSSEPHARKSLGQHFLRDSGVILDIVKAVRLPEGGMLIEIGAGTGQLTGGLLDAGYAVTALEFEPRLVTHLKKRFASKAGLRVIESDARLVDYRDLVDGRPFAIAGNLPYFAANPILRHLLESPVIASDIVIMVQREVAQRIAARPGKLSLLGVSVQVYAEPEMLFDVPPEAFDPPPKVWSSVLRLRPREEPLVPREDIEPFFDLVVKTFRNPRKHLHNSLSMGVTLGKGAAGDVLERANIDPMRRPETLSIPEWLALLAATREVRAGV
jgi:16S rRNA (adenine1518-N6/adenine1519-N6)-dimethyltransferase